MAVDPLRGMKGSYKQDTKEKKSLVGRMFGRRWDQILLSLHFQYWYFHFRNSNVAEQEEANERREGKNQIFDDFSSRGVNY